MEWSAAQATNRPASLESIRSLDYRSADELRDTQSRRLRHLVGLVYDRVGMVRRRMDDLSLRPHDIRGLEDIARLPFTHKTDLRNEYPLGLLAQDVGQVVRMHASSGATGKPILTAYTRGDLDVWAQVVARSLIAHGLLPGDVVQNSYGYGLFTGGLGLHAGIEALGATVIPVSGGNTDRQLTILRDLRVNAICCTPSYFLHLLDRAQQLGISLGDLPLRLGVFGAEPWTEAMRDYIQEAAGIQAFDIYGLAEIIGPGVAAECEKRQGLHVFEDHFYPEIVDPQSGRTLPDGTEGELVLTTLSKQALPLVRYRTGDVTSILPGDCPCGRTIRRIGRILRRADDMFIVRGVNVFPAQIESALLETRQTLPHYQILLTRRRGLDCLEVRVEVQGRRSDSLRAALAEALHRAVGVRVEVTLLAPHSLPRSEGKSQRVVDRRAM